MTRERKSDPQKVVGSSPQWNFELHVEMKFRHFRYLKGIDGIQRIWRVRFYCTKVSLFLFEPQVYPICRGTWWCPFRMPLNGLDSELSPLLA